MQSLKKIDAWAQMKVPIFYAFLSSGDFFQNQLFRKILSGMPSLVSNRLYPNQS